MINEANLEQKKKDIADLLQLRIQEAMGSKLKVPVSKEHHRKSHHKGAARHGSHNITFKKRA